jgi:hypothetical protein
MEEAHVTVTNIATVEQCQTLCQSHFDQANEEPPCDYFSFKQAAQNCLLFAKSQSPPPSMSLQMSTTTGPRECGNYTIILASK